MNAQTVSIVFLIWLAISFEPVLGQRRYLYERMAHLRSGDTREWDDFSQESEGSSLSIEFMAQMNSGPQTLGFRRIDVKEGWEVTLNDQPIGKLFSHEDDMEEVYELAPGMLRNGLNQLVLRATGQKTDDVYLGAIWLDARPRVEALGESTISLTAHDTHGEPLPCRFTIINEAGSLAGLGAESNEQLAVRSGVVYSSTGTASIGLAAGKYTVFCGRGTEYDLQEAEFQISAGESVAREFTLTRVVDTAGLVACDTHVHTFEISRHGDASLTERMITLAGEGIELPVATDHNVFVDYRPHLKRMQLERWMTPVIGNEVTTRFGHFNVFPATVEASAPDHTVTSWSDLHDDIFTTPNLRISILNHPRDVHSGFTPFAPENMIGSVAQRRDGRRLRANAVELINSAAMQTDPMVIFDDWMSIVNRGHHLTAVGSSDSHEVARKIVGQGRSYIYCSDEDPGDINVAAAVESFLAGEVLVSLGLITELTVNTRVHSGQMLSLQKSEKEIAIRVRVQGPEWVTADRIQLFVNGQLERTIPIPASAQNAAGIKADVNWKLENPGYDLQLVAVARGPGVTGLYWPIAKPYQPTSTSWEPYVFGSSGIIRVDCNNDGQWESAYDRALKATTSSKGNFSRLLDALNEHDEPTASFAAHLWEEAGHSIRNQAALTELEEAAPHVQNGFAKYRQSLRASLDAAARTQSGN